MSDYSNKVYLTLEDIYTMSRNIIDARVEITRAEIELEKQMRNYAFAIRILLMHDGELGQQVSREHQKFFKEAKSKRGMYTRATP